jgi:hypothetical protein
MNQEWPDVEKTDTEFELIQDGLGLCNNVVCCTAGDGMKTKAVHA